MRSWPSTPSLWLLAAGSGVVGLVVVVAAPRSPLGALLVAAGLGAVALALDRHLRDRDVGTEQQRRGQAAHELRRARGAVARRPVLTGGLASVLALMGVVGAGALGRYGPRRPGGTGWRDGVRLVGVDGEPLHVDDLAQGGIATVWPEGPGRQERAAAVVLRLPDGASGFVARGPDGAVSLAAYSRICTHAGCPVALYRAEAGILYCPCHQATFDATADAEPIFGPASRALPRLPLGVRSDGFLVARGDFTAPPGPGGGPA